MTQGSRGLAAALASIAAAALILFGIDLTLSMTEYLARRPVNVAAGFIVPTLTALCAAVWVRNGIVERVSGRVEAAERHYEALIVEAEDRVMRRVDDLASRLIAVLNGQVEVRLQLAEATGELPALPTDIAALVEVVVDRALAARAARPPAAVGRAQVLSEAPTVPLGRRRRRRGARTPIDPSTLQLMQRLDEELRHRGDGDARQQDR